MPNDPGTRKRPPADGGGAPVAKAVRPDSEEPSVFHCPVCLHFFDAEDRKPKALPCGHCLCATCCAAVREAKCPSCRAEVGKALKDLPPCFPLLQQIASDGPLFVCGVCRGPGFVKSGWLGPAGAVCGDCRHDQPPGVVRRFRPVLAEEIQRRQKLQQTRLARLDSVRAKRNGLLVKHSGWMASLEGGSLKLLVGTLRKAFEGTRDRVKAMRSEFVGLTSEQEATRSLSLCDTGPTESTMELDVVEKILEDLDVHIADARDALGLLADAAEDINHALI